MQHAEAQRTWAQLLAEYAAACAAFEAANQTFVVSSWRIDGGNAAAAEVAEEEARERLLKARLAMREFESKLAEAPPQKKPRRSGVPIERVTM
jgi:hypothetical protein